MPWPGSHPQPTVSIVMPVQRHHGNLPAAIEAWSSQDYPLDQLELIFVSNGREPNIDAFVRSRLAAAKSPRGDVVYIKTDNEMAQYAFATRYARGEWLLFTEPHCLPQRDCVSELIGGLVSQDMVGGCVRTLSDNSTNRNSRIEERIYAEDFAVWSAAGDWRKFTKRGFALRRDVYRAIGGIQAEYGWFSELILAAQLHADGHRVGYVPSAAVQHFNATNIQEMFDYIWGYQRELVRFIDEGSRRLVPYFAGMSSRAPSPPADVRLAEHRAMRRALVEGLRRIHTRSGRSLAVAMVKAMGDAACSHAVRLACTYWLARLRFACLSLTQEQAYRNFVAAAGHLGRWAEASCLISSSAREVHRADADASISIRPGETDAGLYGFHARERHAGRAFRWTSPVASLHIGVPPGDYELSLDVGDLGRADSPAVVFWNGMRIEAPQGHGAIHVSKRSCAAGRPQVLTLIASPLATRNPRETRALGLALFEVGLRPMLETAARRTA